MQVERTPFQETKNKKEIKGRKEEEEINLLMTAYQVEYYHCQLIV